MDKFFHLKFMDRGFVFNHLSNNVGNENSPFPYINAKLFDIINAWLECFPHDLPQHKMIVRF
jgi:hypothetical protein